VQHSGRLHFKGRRFNLPDAFVGQPVGLRPTDHDGLWNVFFAAQIISQIDLRDQNGQT